MGSALDGLTVIDLTTGAAGALSTLFLSDHGARVVRVIDSDAPGYRDGGFVVWDRGKECVRLDLRAVGEAWGTDARGSAAHDAFVRLVKGADVLVEDFAPSDPQGAIVDRVSLQALNPGLVSCSITAYGPTGPWKDEPPIDDLVLARMGILGSMPGFRPAPVHVVHPLPSVGASILAALGISAALLARESNGLGRSVETSLMAGALLYHPKVTGEKLDRHTFQTHPSGSAPFYSVYECADGNWVQLGCVHARFIAIAGELMGISHTLAEPRFGEGRAPATPEDETELRALLTDIIRTKPYATWAEEFETADVPFAQARWTDQSLDDPQVLHNEMLVDLVDPVVGPMKAMGVALKLTHTPGKVRGPRLACGEINQLPGDWGDKVAQASGTREQGADDALLAPPLQGVRVLEITNLIAGPTGGRLLADLGADVIKFEPLTGDMSRPIGRTYFYSVNFNKRSVSVDTRTDEGKAVVQRIAASADALLANLRPHATERMGITPAINDQLIETHLTGYGWTGPYSRRPGIDPLAQALMGLQRAQGGPENPPVFPAQLAPTDFTTGAVGALGTVMCLLTRTRTGTVQRAESNLLNGGILLASQWFCEHADRGVRPFADKEQYGLTPFHRLYQTADGWVYVAADEPAQGDALLATMGCSEFAGATALDHPNSGPLALALEGAFATGQTQSCLDSLAAVGVPAAPALPGDSELFLEHEHAIENDIVAQREHPKAGVIRVAWPYVRFGQCEPTAGLPTPLLGEHTRAVLEEVGYSATEIEHLYREGVVLTESPV
ncbi:MAG: crotonobetainyl-CoA:carnitine CoA-transferase CaiB-like acyl-CoA transferase [Gammaproteobacteria bacterium]|jgi:crotonobetainyl-CoA:carnitine CoA-transferase CaiB-like acyl-CoA transferase